jgi:hypothetical protein
LNDLDYLSISTFYSHGDGVKDIAFSVEDLDGIMEKAKVGQNYFPGHVFYCGKETLLWVCNLGCILLCICAGEGRGGMLPITDIDGYFTSGRKLLRPEVNY